MILDTLDHVARYTGMNSVLDAGLEYLSKAAATGLADGRYPIDGERLRASVTTSPTRETEAVPFEAHRRYIDIQCLLSGSETIYWMPREGCVVRQEYSAEKDIELLADGRASALILRPGMFAVFFPSDAHKPGCYSARQEEVQKLVIKVRVTSRVT